MIVPVSKNYLKGHIPLDYCRLEGLEALDLYENNLVGRILSCFNAFQNLKHVHLSKNKLQGEFNIFSNNSYLELLDLRDNNFSGSIPKWLDSTSMITTLLLKGNHLQGTITPQLCHARFEKFGGDALINLEHSMESSNALDIYAWVRAEFTTKYNTYSYDGGILSYMSGVDLSCNHLSDEIPKELSNLTEINGLNLSHNHLTGVIPSEFSNLKNIESLYKHRTSARKKCLLMKQKAY
ncbi:hypothetical protein FXO38_30740 [Capsicum annuum]|uniref:Uncharacterized protein n=1 Tax=Capsicum annuum TaxID=4072 RepID=A0A2G2Y4M2_CAPAN|nr:hypothetical protein FXO38_30740 [Capsicum annuum]KAF3652630.1 hypothetical protein FXO37_17438 [Capsicum annuum]PHT64705.1 hypothetical protein T459_29130 [Capsicum annuum]